MTVRWMHLVAFLAACSSGSRTEESPGTEETVELESATCRLRARKVTCEWRRDAAAALVAPGVPAGKASSVEIPEPVFDLAMSPLGTHACAVSERGNVYCWGASDRGQAGVDPANGGADVEVVYPPRLVSPLSNVREVSTSGSSSCALDRSGDVWCWGHLAAAGIEDVSASARPMKVNVRGVTAIAAELLQTCALEPDGARCWGGRVPDRSGRQTHAFGPREVPDTRGATGLRGEIGRMCAIWSDGLERCWSTTLTPLR